MQSVRNETHAKPGVFGAMVAVATMLAVSPAFGLAQTPAEVSVVTPAAAEIPAPASGSEPAATVAPAAVLEEAASDVASSPSLVTPEQVYTAMIEAEKRRAKAMRPDPSVPNSVADQWGVQVIRVDNTANGFWLDFRFRVTDAKKALPLFDSRIKPYLESEHSGVKLAVPSAAKVGALRTTNRGHNVKPGKIYNIMFANPGFHVKPGQKVSVVIGDFKVEHLIVN